MNGRLENKVAIITGAASGFGAAFTARFVAEGARVLALDIAGERGADVIDALAVAADQATFARCDVSNSADVARSITRCEEHFGRVDIVVANAGIASPQVAIEDMDEALFDRLFAVNVKSVYLFARHAVPALRRAGGGSILNTASTSALKPRPGNAGYAASKAAVIAWTKALAVELAPDRIRVNAPTPVAADTPLFRDFVGADAETHIARIAAAIPLGRLCHPDDMAAAAVFLCSDEAGFLTGVSLPVDGGWTAS